MTEERLEELRTRAKQNCAPTQHCLGEILVNGYCYVEKNHIEGIHWLRKSAKNGFTEAFYDWGKVYYGGDGVKRDCRKAAKLFRQAAKKDCTNRRCTDAQFKLSDMYAKGEGVKQNLKLAKKWYVRAEKAWRLNKEKWDKITKEATKKWQRESMLRAITLYGFRKFLRTKQLQTKIKSMRLNNYI